MDKDLSDHGAIAYGSLSDHTRDLPDTDLSDHGAIAYGSLSDHTRDLPDTDLSDHGAIAYGSLSGHTRDLPDADLSDHGAVPYASKKETWGTNDEEIAKKISILMNASYTNDFEQIIPLLNAESLAKLVNYRYRMTANIMDSNRNGLNKDDKETLGINMNMDFLVIKSILASNPHGLEQIFTPSLYTNDNNLTDIFGVLGAYQQGLNNLGVEIPLINGATGQPLVNENGAHVTAQEAINYLKAAQSMSLEEDSNENVR